MGIFDMFRKRKPIPAPWSKYYTDEELDIIIPNISLYKQVVNSSESYPDFLAYKYLGDVLVLVEKDYSNRDRFVFILNK